MKKLSEMTLEELVQHLATSPPGVERIDAVLRIYNFVGSVKQVAKVTGMRRQIVTDAMRISRDPVLFERVRKGEISPRKARDLLTVRPRKRRDPSVFNGPSSVTALVFKEGETSSFLIRGGASDLIDQHVSLAKRQGVNVVLPQ